MKEGPGAETQDREAVKEPRIPGDADTMSRRAWLGGAAVVAGAGITCAMPTAAEAKVSQKSVSYQAEPKSKTNMCGTCKYFIAPKACVLVDGDVSPAGWCQLYEKKS